MGKALVGFGACQLLRDVKKLFWQFSAVGLVQSRLQIPRSVQGMTGSTYSNHYET